MLEPPDLPQAHLVACLRAHYDLLPAAIDFLPIGYDATSWVFAVTAGDGTRSFLKLKRGTFPGASLAVPCMLRDAGIVEVVAPLRAVDGALQATCDGYSLALYPFVEGNVDMAVGLTPAQWTALGSTLRRVHNSRPPDVDLALVGREDFASPWLTIVRKIAARLEMASAFDPIAHEFAAVWQDQRVRIERITERMIELGQMLHQRPPAFVLCHADIHTANILVDAAGALHIVDWDGVILAPKERDLMFMLGNTVDDSAQRTWQETAFLAGYGPVSLDPTALTYYRYEWVVQELGDFGARICFADDVSDVTRADALSGFRQLFAEGDVVEGTENCKIED